MQKVTYREIMKLAHPITVLSYFDNKLAAYFVYFVQNTWFSPNMATYGSFVLHMALCAIILFSHNMYLEFSLPLWCFISYTLDNVDGILARVKGMATPFGGFQDAASDRIKDVCMLFVIGYKSGSLVFALSLIASFAFLLGITLSEIQFFGKRKKIKNDENMAPSRPKFLQLRYSGAEIYLALLLIVFTGEYMYGSLFFIFFYLVQSVMVTASILKRKNEVILS